MSPATTLALALAAKPAPAQTLIVNARVFDGRSDKLADRMSVLIEGNQIAKVSKVAIAPPTGATVINANGRTLMPGLIDTHTHIMFAAVSQVRC